MKYFTYLLSITILGFYGCSTNKSIDSSLNAIAIDPEIDEWLGDTLSCFKYLLVSQLRVTIELCQLMTVVL
jgi:hypothetical protein